VNLSIAYKTTSRCGCKRRFCLQNRALPVAAQKLTFGSFGRIGAGLRTNATPAVALKRSAAVPGRLWLRRVAGRGMRSGHRGRSCSRVRSARPRRAGIERPSVVSPNRAVPATPRLGIVATRRSKATKRRAPPRANVAAMLTMSPESSGRRPQRVRCTHGHSDGSDPRQACLSMTQGSPRRGCSRP
jgi:hypothetical protein